MVETRLSGVSDATVREVTPLRPDPDPPDPTAGPGPKPGGKQFKGAADRKRAAQAAPQAKPGLLPVFEAPPHPSLLALRMTPPRHVEQSAAQISPKPLPIGTELQEAFRTQDLGKLLNVREELHRMLKSGALESEALIEVRTLTRLADGAWEKFKALSLIAANDEIDQKTLGTDNNNSKAAFEAREQYRKEAVAFISKLTLEQCAQRSVLARYEEHSHGAGAVFLWEVGLEKDLLFHVGNAGWVSINQAKMDSGILSIVPRQQIDGQTLSGADIIDLDRTGKQSFDSKYLQARLTEAVELAPAVYLRHIAFTEEKPELRSEAILNLQEMILPPHWTATRDGDVRQRFATMQNQEGGKLEAKIKEITAQNLPADKSQEAIMKAKVEWLKHFAQRSYEFVKDERQAGRLQLSANGEKAFRELNGMYSGSDAKRAQLNHWLDIAAINAPMIAFSGGIANIARAGVQSAIERYVVRSLGEEALARVTVKASTYAVAKLAEGYVFQATESGLSYLGGNKDAFSNFWSDGLKSTVVFVGMHGAAKLAQRAIMGVAGRTLSNEARIAINSLLNSDQRQAYLAQVIQANGKLRALNLAGHLTAETLYFALQGKTEAVIGGKPLSSLLSPAEWAEALGQSAMQIAALKTGRYLTKPIEQSIAGAHSNDPIPSGPLRSIAFFGDEPGAAGNEKSGPDAKSGESVRPKPESNQGTGGVPPGGARGPDETPGGKAPVRSTPPLLTEQDMKELTSAYNRLPEKEQDAYHGSVDMFINEVHGAFRELPEETQRTYGSAAAYFKKIAKDFHGLSRESRNELGFLRMYFGLAQRFGSFSPPEQARFGTPFKFFKHIQEAAFNGEIVRAFSRLPRETQEAYGNASEYGKKISKEFGNLPGKWRAELRSPRGYLHLVEAFNALSAESQAEFGDPLGFLKEIGEHFNNVYIAPLLTQFGTPLRFIEEFAPEFSKLSAEERAEFGDPLTFFFRILLKFDLYPEESPMRTVLRNPLMAYQIERAYNGLTPDQQKAYGYNLYRYAESEYGGSSGGSKLPPRSAPHLRLTEQEYKSIYDAFEKQGNQFSGHVLFWFSLKVTQAFHALPDGVRSQYQDAGEWLELEILPKFRELSDAEQERYDHSLIKYLEERSGTGKKPASGAEEPPPGARGPGGNEASGAGGGPQTPKIEPSGRGDPEPSPSNTGGNKSIKAENPRDKHPLVQFIKGMLRPSYFGYQEPSSLSPEQQTLIDTLTPAFNRIPKDMRHAYGDADTLAMLVKNIAVEYGKLDEGQRKDVGSLSGYFDIVSEFYTYPEGSREIFETPIEFFKIRQKWDTLSEDVQMKDFQGNLPLYASRLHKGDPRQRDR
jgi:hypothetical protein